MSRFALIGALTDVAMALLVLPCLGGAALLLLYILPGLHGASLGNCGLPLALLLWGASSAVAVIRRRAWGRNSFLAWASASSIALVISGVNQAFDWPQVLIALGVLVISAVGVVMAYGRAQRV